MAQRSDLTILIVEDEFLLAMELQESLRYAGYNVAGFASSPKAALRLARQTRPSLILTDINLCGAFEGIDLARQIKAELGCAVIFMTAYSDRFVHERAAATGPAAIVQKPFRQAELLRALDQVAAREAAPR